MPDGLEQRIVLRPVEDEMRRSYIDYAMSVIVGRALPDVRDGLKPVQRRILFSMNDLGLASGSQHRKSARVVGDTLGRLHPHGDMAVYDALVRMAQTFSLRALLVDGQGNMGSVDGDPPAAMRYTEVRLSKVAEEILQDLDKETVDFADNFDGTLKEPTVLPAKFPNLLVNGASGIAVGMATSIPPHNLGEVVDALVAVIDRPDVPVEELVNPESGPIRGPDFPTGGIIYGFAGVLESYRTGRGTFRVRARYVTEGENGKRRLVFTEIPYMVNKGSLLETIAQLVKDRKLDGVTDLRDESDREGMSIVIELRKDASEDVVLNQLFAHTQLEETFGTINLALVDGKPVVLPLKDTLQHYVTYREEIVRRRTAFDLRKARAREHIVEGLLTAVDHLDDVITLIRRAKQPDDAKAALINRYLLTEEQAKAILDLRLQRLTSLGVKELQDERAQLSKTIHDLEAILASRERVRSIIRDELLQLKEAYADPRRTQIEVEAVDRDVEDLIPVEDHVVTITNTGYIKRLPVRTYRQQRRGGMGVTGMETKEEDYVVNLFIASSHDYILFFTSKGKAFWLKTYHIPLAGRYAKGRPLVNMLPRMEADEHIQATIPVHEFDDRRFLVFVTKNGVAKRTKLSAYGHPNIRGIRAITLRPKDELIDARVAEGDEEVVLATRGGYACRFAIHDVRAMGRTAAGVRGVRLYKDDHVVSMALSRHAETELLTILENGLGKRTVVSEYRKTRRGGHGVQTTNMKLAKSGVNAVIEVHEDDQLLITTKRGIVIRVPVKGIRQTGRRAKGVRLQRLEDGDEVMAVARIISEAEEERVVAAGAEAA